MIVGWVKPCLCNTIIVRTCSETFTMSGLYFLARVFRWADPDTPLLSISFFVCKSSLHAMCIIISAMSCLYIGHPKRCFLFTSAGNCVFDYPQFTSSKPHSFICLSFHNACKLGQCIETVVLYIHHLCSGEIGLASLEYTSRCNCGMCQS